MTALAATAACSSSAVEQLSLGIEALTDIEIIGYILNVIVLTLEIAKPATVVAAAVEP